MKDKKTQPKILKGEVVSDVMEKTVVVAVRRLVKDRKYGKFVRRMKRFKAHDEKKEYKKGDNVFIKESKPLSKDKHFVAIGKA